jgi:acetolactate synthase regulatory subunit
MSSDGMQGMARILREFGLRTQSVQSIAAAPTRDSNNWLIDIVSTGAVDRMYILTCRVARIPTVESIDYHEVDSSSDTQSRRGALDAGWIDQLQQMQSIDP